MEAERGDGAAGGDSDPGWTPPGRGANLGLGQGSAEGLEGEDQLPVHGWAEQ